MTVTRDDQDEDKLLRKWMLEFLECDGLGVLLESLEKLGARGFSSVADTFSQLQCVTCLRAVMNSQVGLEFIVRHREYTRQLANILMSRNNSVKLQVFELLCALCMYSRQGYDLALDSLNYFKMSHGRRYRFDLVVHELQMADTVAYQTTLLAFVNCVILGCQELSQRIKIRTELFGVGLEQALTVLRYNEDAGLQIQLKAFDDSQASDEEIEEPLTVDHFFNVLYKKVANTPQVLSLHSLLLTLSQIDPSDPKSDQIWEALQEVIAEHLSSRKSLRKRSLASTREFGTQTTSHQRWSPVKKKSSFSVSTQVDSSLISHIDRTDHPDNLRLPSSLINPIDDSAPKNVANQGIICKNCLLRITDENNQSSNAPNSAELGDFIEHSHNNIPSSSSTSRTSNQRLSFTKIRKLSDPLSPLNQSNKNTNSIDETLIRNIVTTQDSSMLTSSRTSVRPIVSKASLSPSCSLTTSSNNHLHLPCSRVVADNSDPSTPPPQSEPQPRISSLPPSSPTRCNGITSMATPSPAACNRIPPPPTVCNNEETPPPTVNTTPPSQTPPQPPQMPPPPPMPSNGMPPPPPMPSNGMPPPPPMPSNGMPPPPPMPSNGMPPPPPMPSNGMPPPPPMPSNGMPPPPPMLCNGSPPPPPPPLLNGQPAVEAFVTSERLMENQLALSPNRTTLNNYYTLPTRKLISEDNFHKYNTLPKPSKKMKTLNWTKVPNQTIEKSIWAHATAPQMPINYIEIEELFCQMSRKKSLQSPSKTDTSTPVLTSLLDSKRSLAVNIFLKQFKTGASGVLQALRDCSSMPVEKLKCFLRILPDEQEVALIKSHQGELSTLDTAERFFAQLLSVPDYALRAEAMLQKEECPSIVAELSPQLQALTNLCDSLTQDTRLAEFLALLLQLGNYLNAGSYAGNAAGFKLNTLPKLLDTRANKPRMTFLHFAVDIAQTNRSDLLSFTKEMSRLKEVARNPLVSLEEEVKILAVAMRKLEKQVKAAKSKDILPKFKEFLKEGLQEVVKLEGLVKAAKAAETRLAEHFCEDPLKFQPEECFMLLADFYAKVNQTVIDNNQRRKQEERVAKMEAAKQESNNILSPKSPTNRKTGKTRIFNEDETALVDILMGEIKTGTFKLRRSLPTGNG